MYKCKECIINGHTLITPTIISVEIKIVMQRFMTNIIFTISVSKSKNIVLNATRVVKITIIVMMDRMMANRPEAMEPLRVDVQKQQEFNGGFAILY